jgi:hypothetical protein
MVRQMANFTSSRALRVAGANAGISMRMSTDSRTGAAGPIASIRAGASFGSGRGIHTSHVQSVHLSYRIASTGRDTGRDDAVDFRRASLPSARKKRSAVGHQFRVKNQVRTGLPVRR